LISETQIRTLERAQKELQRAINLNAHAESLIIFANALKKNMNTWREYTCGIRLSVVKTVI
jgi:hypothetical protein